MVRQPLTLVLTLLTVTVACRRPAPAGDAGDTTGSNASMSEEAQAGATVQAMLALATQGEWEAYVDLYYGESHKFTSPADRTALVERFEQQWSTRVIDGLRQAGSVTPTIDDEGRAVFSVDGQPVFVLYKSDTGRWMFHL